MTNAQPPRHSRTPHPSRRLSGFVCYAIVCCLALYGSSFGQTTGWEAVEALLTEIVAPSFPDRDFVLTDFRRDGEDPQDWAPAFSRAITKCHEAGGGRVVVPAGRWRVGGPIRLKSHVNLHLVEGSTLLFSNDPSDYLPPVFTRFEGTELMNYSPPIYALDEANIAVTGSGTLDGQASEKSWWDWKGDGDGDIAKLRSLAETGTPPEQRIFGDGFHLRPNFVQFYRCRQVLIEGVTVTGSPMWNLHPVLCENVIVRGVTVDSHGPNNDGCNPESCRNVLIEDCKFDTGDDCIAIKAGRDADGRRVAVASENIVVRRCQMKDGHGGVVLGSEMTGGIRNVFVEDCQMDSPHLERAIRLKSNSMRGGFLENLFVRNITVGEVSDAVLRINLEYSTERGNHFPLVRNIHLENVTSAKSRYPLYLVGLEQQPIQDVTLVNCTFADAKKPSVMRYVEELNLRNVSQPGD